MDVANFFSLIPEYGFPIILSWYLLIRMEGKLDKLTEVISQLGSNVNTLVSLNPRMAI